MAADSTLNVWVPELTWRSGKINDTSALRILKLVEAQTFDIRQLPVYTQGVQDLSEDIIKTWIKLLLSHSDHSTIDVAFDLYHTYYLRGSQRSLPEELTLILLTHPSLFQETREFRHDPSFGHFWEIIAKTFMQQYASQRGRIADLIFEHFGEDTPIFHSMFSPGQGVLLEMIRQYPEEIWTRIIKSLESSKDRRIHKLEYWLKGYDSPDPDMEGGGILPMFPMEIVWQWIDKHVEERAPYFAKFVPKQLFREEGRPCWIREFLVRYGNAKAVRDRLIKSFLAYGYTGSQSVYLQNKRQELLDFRKAEESENVRRWIDEYVAVLEYDLERVKIEEERRGF